MLGYLFVASTLLIGVLPVAYLRKNIITSNELFGIFVGNYLFFSVYFLLIVLLLIPVHYFVRKFSLKELNISICTLLVLVGAFGYYHYRFPDLVFENIQLEKSAEQAHLRIAFISDLHLNSNSNKALFADAVEKINATNVDLILVGGDILQDSHKQVRDNYQEVFSKLKSTYGAYAIMGNHEYYGNNAEENIIYVESLGFKVLRDSLVNIAGVQIIARDDKYNDGRASLESLYQKLAVDLAKPIVVVDHNPKSIPETLQLKADLQLSGHTHAGQFFPLNFVLDLFYENARGYKRFDDLHTIVSEGLGVGYWRIVGPWQMPYRFGTNSEINIIDLSFSTEN